MTDYFYNVERQSSRRLRDWADRHQFLALVLIYCAVLSPVIAIAAIQPYFEARQYEKMTGKKVSYWDAVWLDLRVVNESR